MRRGSLFAACGATQKHGRLKDVASGQLLASFEKRFLVSNKKVLPEHNHTLHIDKHMLTQSSQTVYVCLKNLKPTTHVCARAHLVTCPNSLQCGFDIVGL